MEYDITHKDGKPYVMIPIHEYRAMTKGGISTSDNLLNLPDEVLTSLEEKKNHPIKIIRKYRGLTQKELASKAEISRPFLTEIETGKKNGSIHALKQIAEALEVSIDIIMA